MHPRYQPGDVLLRQGAGAAHVLLPTQAQVKVPQLELQGGELLLAGHGPGNLLEKMAVLDGGERSTMVGALTRCLTYAASTERFHKLMYRFHPHGLLICRAVEPMSCSRRGAS